MEVQQPQPQAQPAAPPCWSNIVKQQQQQQPPPHSSSAQLPIALAAEEHTERVGSCRSAKGIAVAVVDANAIIQGGGRLGVSADRFVSVPEVIREIRDPTSRHSLNFLPFNVDTVEPSPDALKKVISFARVTGDLQTLSDVDLKLIALTYMMEAQIHGTQHLRNSPPPIHMVNVKRLPEKDLPGWGSNVPNLEEWEALEQAVEDRSNPNSRILPLKDLNLNVIPEDQQSLHNRSTADRDESHSVNQEDADGGFRKPRKYMPKKKEVKIEGKKMVADGIDASQGQFDDDAGDWRPAVSRSTHRRFLRRKARREMYGVSSEKDEQHDVTENMEIESLGGSGCPDLPEHKNAEEDPPVNLTENKAIEETPVGEDISTILSRMRLEEESLQAPQGGKKLSDLCEDLSFSDSTGQDAACENGECITSEEEDTEVTNEELENFELASETSENVGASHADDDSSEQSWMLRPLSDSSVACITSDFAMQNVLLQMGLRLLAPGGMQIRELHRWVLKCHACFKVTAEIGRIFCPSCGNGGTLRKVAVTVGENGIVLAARRPRVSLRGTKFSLPLPQGGRDAITKNPVLREDQLPKKFLYPKTKKKTKQGDDDIFASNDIFLHHTDKRAPLQPPIRKALAVFSQKRNPNDNHYSRPKH